MRYSSFFALLLIAVSCQSGKENSLRPVAPVSFADVTIQDAFWSPRLDSHKDVTLAALGK